jgi:hypothetical protein
VRTDPSAAGRVYVVAVVGLDGHGKRPRILVDEQANGELVLAMVRVFQSLIIGLTGCGSPRMGPIKISG